MVNPTEPKILYASESVIKHPYHIRYQIENPDDLEAPVNDRIVEMGYDVATFDVRIRGMMEQRVLRNRALDALRERLIASNRTPAEISWGEDLLDVIKAINNA